VPVQLAVAALAISCDDAPWLSSASTRSLVSMRVPDLAAPPNSSGRKASTPSRPLPPMARQHVVPVSPARAAMSTPPARPAAIPLRKPKPKCFVGAYNGSLRSRTRTEPRQRSAVGPDRLAISHSDAIARSICSDDRVSCLPKPPSGSVHARVRRLQAVNRREARFDRPHRPAALRDPEPFSVRYSGTSESIRPSNAV